MIELVQKKTVIAHPSIRTRKIQYGYFDRRPFTPHPVIHLSGKYLETYGFGIGDMIEVHLDTRRIVITKATAK